MGKTTLCNAITGLLPPGTTARGAIRLAGEPILGLTPNAITERGVAYVPQGRRVWPSLSVDEHLRLASRGANRGAWTVDRVYKTFPRLAERKGNGGAQLSGGEQQMLAIARALLLNPASAGDGRTHRGPRAGHRRAGRGDAADAGQEGEIAVLLIEQNLGVAIAVADTIDVMVNGRIARTMPAAELDGRSRTAAAPARRPRRRRRDRRRSAAGIAAGTTARVPMPDRAPDVHRSARAARATRSGYSPSGAPATRSIPARPGPPTRPAAYATSIGGMPLDPQVTPRDRLLERSARSGRRSRRCGAARVPRCRGP